ncbi:uncharacterized protein EV154DRAFT_487835 [Mucor mucedo]|uniref:uncharacterized protein n=1 Tax=Mucor mucedo TaxID=29922 RepID=UPI00221EBE99|nr:uncharacterized protein EV154DRAFT_487835 [Mucor mucedo]KAI7870279.1 hypothetical protein EV154DRAFT_487835 [Mucor mucedo]
MFGMFTLLLFPFKNAFIALFVTVVLEPKLWQTLQSRPGYSFIIDSENNTLVDIKTSTYVLRHILSSPTLRQQYQNLDSRTINVTLYSKWLRDVGKFVEFLAVMCDVTSGQPTREHSFVLRPVYSQISAQADRSPLGFIFGVNSLHGKKNGCLSFMITAGIFGFEDTL